MRVPCCPSGGEGEGGSVKVNKYVEFSQEVEVEIDANDIRWCFGRVPRLLQNERWLV